MNDRLVYSDICPDCGDRRWRLAGDPTHGDHLVKRCETCGTRRPL